MKLKFEGYQINNIASRYDYQRDEDKLINLKKIIQRQGHLNKKQLQLVAKWKAPRSAGHVQKNTNEYFKDVTAFAFSTKIERSRIETLTILDGISWPTASVLLHLFHEDPYPILDFRALWSASLDVPKQYSFGYWSPYVLCRTALVGDRYAEWCGRAPQ